MTRRETRLIEMAIEKIANGKHRHALETLCSLVHRPVPELQSPRKARLSEVPKRQRGALVAASPSEVDEVLREICPQPKRRRVKDRNALMRFRVDHPTCAIAGCGRRAEPHHLWPRSLGGPDEEWCLFPLCGGPEGHHTGRASWHSLGPERFLEEYSARLSVEDKIKIADALARGAAMKRREESA